MTLQELHDQIERLLAEEPGAADAIVCVGNDDDALAYPANALGFWLEEVPRAIPVACLWHDPRHEEPFEAGGAYDQFVIEDNIDPHDPVVWDDYADAVAALQELIASVAGVETDPAPGVEVEHVASRDNLSAAVITGPGFRRVLSIVRYDV